LVAVLLSCKAKQGPVTQKPAQEVKKPAQQTTKKDTVITKPQQKTGSYNFMLFLPVDLAAAFETDSISPDSIVSTGNFNEELTDAINFYEGALLAADSLRRAGHDVKLKVVDLPPIEDRQTTKIWVQKYENVNLVFAMVKGKPLKTLNDILSVRKIPLISCEANTYSVVEKNPYAVCAQPSSLTQCKMMGTFAGKKFKTDNFIILTSNTDKEKERSSAFISGFQDTMMAGRFRKINYPAEGAEGLGKALSSSYTNTIFIPSTDEDFVTSIYSQLETYQGLYRFRIIGLPVWQYFETIDMRLLEKYNTIFFAPEYYSYDEKDVLHFRTKFRQQFSSEPSDEAYLGYDAFLQFGNLFINQQLPFAAPEINLKGLRSAYYFQHADAAAAENKYINVVKIENFRYIKLNEN
jgi:ABC-type branched-subunit amino acid transport system substrate-binding protein